MKFALALALGSQLVLCSFDSPGPSGPAPQADANAGVSARSLRAEVRIVEGVATTRLHLVVANSFARPAEATWILPLAEGAAVDDFKMTIGGVLTGGDVLPADRARDVYESIVRTRRDPGLCEYFGRGCLRARVFPIPPHGEVEIEVGYREVLPELAGVERWSFPIGAAGIDGRAPQQVSLDLVLDSAIALHNVFSPTAGLDVAVKSDHGAHASYEGRGASVSNGEFALCYSLSDEDFGIDLASTKVRGDDEGTFMLLVSPKRDGAADVHFARAITFALDISGSMEGAKLDQALGALRYFLRSLTPADRFDVVSFSTDATPMFPEMVAADEAHVRDASKRASALFAAGGTNLDEALRESLVRMPKDGERMPIVVLLTDGCPTVQETDRKKILEHTRSWNGSAARIFVFGVGDDVDTTLLDSLAEETRATRNYVRPNEDIGLATSDLFQKLGAPAMTDLELTIDGVETSRTSPSRLPDLFRGGRLTLFGRYRGNGAHTIRLTGRVGVRRVECTREVNFADRPIASCDFLPSLWAERRVASLLDQMRLHGRNGELVDEVRKLGVDYHIVTPYTAHLILEDGLRNRPTTGATGSPGPSSPTTPGPAGPSTPGPAGAAPTTPGGPSTPGPSGPSTAGPSGSVPIFDIDRIAKELVSLGVLPKKADPKELRELALEISREMRAADAALSGLANRSSGSSAVDDSAYLARLLGSDAISAGNSSSRSGRDLASLFERRVKDKNFVLRGGVWTDRELGDAKTKRVVLEAYSDAWFAEIAKTPELAPYFAFSARLVVVLDATVYEVRPPTDGSEAAAKLEKR